jgi:hypothetical protein
MMDNHDREAREKTEKRRDIPSLYFIEPEGGPAQTGGSPVLHGVPEAKPGRSDGKRSGEK